MVGKEKKEEEENPLIKTWIQIILITKFLNANLKNRKK